jgi:DNA-damage-inducible protein D
MFLHTGERNITNICYTKIMTNNLFEEIKQLDKNGNEFWYARAFAKILGYADFGNFENVIIKAKEACRNSGYNVEDHLGDITEMIDIGKGGERGMPSFKLSRYGCYLVAQNGNPRKIQVAMAQTYFAVKTREKEVQDNLIEDQKRIFLRDEMTHRNKTLVSAASVAGVKNFANFQDQGYIGLYGGLHQKEVKRKKGLSDRDQLLDNVGSDELIANLFRASQAEAKIRRDNVQGEQVANQTHKKAGEEVREAIKRLGGEMPETLPRKENIKIVKGRVKKSVNKKSLSIKKTKKMVN